MKVFELNQFGVILNPNEKLYFISNDNQVTIRTGYINNKWYYGLDYTGHNEGLRFWSTRELFETEDEAIKCAKNYFIDRLKNSDLESEKYKLDLIKCIEMDLQ